MEKINTSKGKKLKDKSQKVEDFNISEIIEVFNIKHLDEKENHLAEIKQEKEENDYFIGSYQEVNYHGSGDP